MSIQGKPRSGRQGNRGTVGRGACMAFGAAIGGLVALGAVRFGEAFGSLMPIAAAAIGALAGRFFFSALGRKADDAGGSNSADTIIDSAGGESDADEPSDPSVAPESETAAVSDAGKKPDAIAIVPPAEPEWPVETYEVQVKLDLARSYVEMGDSELALQYLQEALEMELAVGRKLGSEVLKETREQTPGTGT